MNVTEKWGDNVDSAVELALAELKLTREEVDVGLVPDLLLSELRRKKQNPLWKLRMSL